ncbi:hypothetical protein ACQKEX_14735 [Bacillus pumilus]|uniref:hypothetical protein n=1 Tax=Bacillus TaxID=1386 RepID=UPI000964B796|nr:hypothetical protein [Bacillus pumilus]MBU8576413.1 hypothetical protein [Bacillus pumilus]OLP64386.1 hypothetical protein BACPU_26110 [Bacillus pumilus]
MNYDFMTEDPFLVDMVTKYPITLEEMKNIYNAAGCNKKLASVAASYTLHSGADAIIYWLNRKGEGGALNPFINYKEG